MIDRDRHKQLDGNILQTIRDDLEHMFGSVDAVYQRHLEIWGDRPFHEQEEAGTSLLLASAARSDCLAVMEWPIDRGRTGGRSDLWVARDNRQYWFECKRTGFGKKNCKYTLESELKIALKQIDGLGEFSEDEYGIACIYCVYPGENAIDLLEEYEKLKDKFLHVMRIGPKDSNWVYLFFAFGKSN